MKDISILEKVRDKKMLLEHTMNTTSTVKMAQT